MSDKNYSDEIRRIRTDRGLSLAALSEQSSVAKSTLQLIESGEANVSVETLKKVCAALGHELRLSVRKQPKASTGG